MKKIIKFIPLGIFLCIMFLSFGYASFSSKVTISGITASIRPEKDIRITNFYAISNENNGQSLWEEYSVNRIASDIVMPQEDSTVSYKIRVTNLGGVSMGITEITGLPSNMEIIYNDYTLGETLCDSTKNEEPCKLGVQKEINITVKYKDGEFNSEQTEYQLRLDIVFACSYTVIYNQYLPDEYQEVEYIESTGTQYIDTGVVPTNTLKTEFVYMDTSAIGSNYVLGSRTGANGTTIHYGLVGQSADLSIDAYYNSAKGINFNKTRVENEKYHVILNIERDYENGYRMYALLDDLTADSSEEIYTPYYSDGITESVPNIYVFAIKNGNIHRGMRLYSLKFWSSKELIRNFIPCYRKSDNVVGLYDMVTKEFYTNSGTENFTYGPNVNNQYHQGLSQKLIYGISDNLSLNTQTKEGYHFVGWNTMPDGSSTTYIDEQEVINLSTSNGDEVNLYAMWNPNSYTINYIMNNLSLDIESDLSFSDSTNDSITENEGVYTIVKNGLYTGLYLDESNFKDGSTYILKYKLKKSSGTLQNVGGNSANGIEKSFTIDGVPSPTTYAQPKTNLTDDTNEHIIEYKFEYDKDIVSSTSSPNKKIYIQVNRLGSNAPSVTVDIYDIEVYEVYDYKTYYYDKTDTIISSPLKNGYTFIGWNTEPDGSGTMYNVDQEIINLSSLDGAQINLYPQWTHKSYAGVPIYHMVEDLSIPGNKTSEFVTATTGIDFSKSAGDTNGKGVYTFTGTENDTYPTYYYRGMVDNNNVIFANYCWKIVRTTETGGTKLIFNGLSEDGKCNKTGLDTQLANKIKFNSTGKLEAGGYSYGTTHSLLGKTVANVPTGSVFGNDVEYENGKYTFIGDTYIKDDNMANDIANILKTHHYTCFKTADEECTSMYFVFMFRGTALYYVALNSEETINTAISSAITNSSNATSSTIKKYIDDWYANNMTTFTDYLEDTVWCNDRSYSSAIGWTKDGDLLDEAAYKMNFGAYDRLVNNKNPSLTCTNLSDRFTVYEKNGNGDLTYPTALLTLDETALAGYVWGEYSYNNYLNNDEIWWTMSPTLVSVGYVYMGVLYSIMDNVHAAYTTGDAGGVRPSISLEYGTKINSGYGTTTQPFTIE